MSKITKMFSKKKKPAPLPELPEREDKEIQAARKKAVVDARIRRGHSSNILTSPLGISDEAKPRKSTLFGE